MNRLIKTFSKAFKGVIDNYMRKIFILSMNAFRDKINYIIINTVVIYIFYFRQVNHL